MKDADSLCDQPKAPVSDFSPAEEDLLALAPFHLPSFRSSRYTGENERRHLSDFAPEDARLLEHVYTLLEAFFLDLKPCYFELLKAEKVVDKFIASGCSGEMINTMRQVGSATFADTRLVGLERSIHDLRGGAFQALAFRLELLAIAPEVQGVQTLFFLVRDHLKIMRNVIQDLDLESYEKDCVGKNHDAQLLVEKWSQTEFHASLRPVQVVLRCLYEGTLCESCLEFSTLDRIIYNLMNNAAQNTSDGMVRLFVLPIPADPMKSVRFVVCNSVTSDQRKVLTEQFQDDLGEIFCGGYTTHGHGVGLRICADFCSQAYGLSNFRTAMAAGYFGADWIHDQFTVWFHWPIGLGMAAPGVPF